MLSWELQRRQPNIWLYVELNASGTKVTDNDSKFSDNLFRRRQAGTHLASFFALSEMSVVFYAVHDGNLNVKSAP